MAIVIEVVLWLGSELVLQIVAEGLVTLGLEWFKEPRNEPPHPVLAGAGCMLLGAVTGGVLTFVYPHHVAPSPSLPFFAIVVLPLLVGAGAFWLGTRAERAGRPRPALSTFWGGLLFALGLCVTRFLLLGSGWRLTSA